MSGFVDGFLRGDYMPHGHCFLWQPGILWVNVISDVLIALAYFSIPLTLLVLLRKRKDLRFRSIFILFGLFIFSCGLTHLFSIYNLWHGAYGLQGIMKAITAIVSIATAAVLYRLLPSITSLPSPDEFRALLEEAANEKLQRSELEISRKAEAIFQFTTELIPTGLLVIDGKRNIRLVNNALEQIFGYQRGELIGRPLDVLLNHESAGHHDVLVEKYMLNPTQRHAMAAGRLVKGRTKNGQNVSIEISLSVHEFEGEKHAFASVVDVGRVVSEKSLFMESTNRIRRAIDATNDGIWEWNVKSNDVWYSPRLIRMIGLKDSPDEVGYEDWQRHIHPDDYGRVMTVINTHFEQHKKYDVIYRGMAESGHYEWFHARGDTIFDHDDQPLLMSGVLTNINDKKLLEQSLEEQTRFLNAVLEKSLSGMYIFDLKRKANSFINTQYTEITGYSMDDLRSLEAQGGLMELFHPDDREKVVTHIAEVVKSQSHQGVPLQYRLRHKDGHWIWCYSKDSIYAFDDQGQATEMLGTFFDISELVEREQKIEKLAQDFSTTFEQAAVGIAHVALDGTFLRVNEKLCDILGYSLDDLLACSFQEVTHPDDLEADLDNVGSLIKGKADSFSMEKRYICKDGRVIWANLTVSIVRNEDGSNSHFISVIEDISERKSMEQALAESNDSLERFAYSASHDLQEPLRKISAFSDSIQRRLVDKLQEPEAQFELGRIADAASRMRSMIDSLLQLSRFARKKLEKEEMMLSTVLDWVKDDLSTLIQENDVDLQLRSDGIVKVDKGTFQLVLRNLIVNGVRYAQLGVRPVIALSYHREGPNVRIVYTDNGRGFDDAYRYQIFEPFKRLVGKDIQGSGMGLAICKQIVKAHGGDITAHGCLETGATFDIVLPRDGVQRSE